MLREYRLIAAVLAAAGMLCAASAGAKEKLSEEELLKKGEAIAANCAACHVLEPSAEGPRPVGVPSISGIPRKELFRSIAGCPVSPAGMSLTDYGDELRQQERVGKGRPGHGTMMSRPEIHALMTYLESLPRR